MRQHAKATTVGADRRDSGGPSRVPAERDARAVRRPTWSTRVTANEDTLAASIAVLDDENVSPLALRSVVDEGDAPAVGRPGRAFAADTAVNQPGRSAEPYDFDAIADAAVVRCGSRQLNRHQEAPRVRRPRQPAD